MHLLRKKRIWALVAGTVLSLSVLTGTAYGRVTGWTSAETIFTPQQAEIPDFSDCLVAGGQQVLLADWASTEAATKTIQIQTSSPVTQEQIICTVSTDAVTCTATPGAESGITLTLNRTAVPTEETTVTIQVAWKDRVGTFCIDLLPENHVMETVPDAGNALQGSCSGVLNRENPLGWIQVNWSSGNQVWLTLPCEKVRCSLDGGESFTMLYDIQAWQVTPPDDWNGLLLLDFSQANLGAGSQTVSVQVGETHADLTFTGKSPIAVEPVFLTAAQLPHTITIQADWGSAIASLQVQRFNGTGYENTGSLTAALSGDRLTLTGRPDPGTYRLVIQWKWKQISIAEQNIYLIVNTK